MHQLPALHTSAVWYKNDEKQARERFLCSFKSYPMSAIEEE